MISLLFIYMSVPRAGALTHAHVVGADAPANCVEAEVRRRTVRLETDRTTCSGVITDPDRVRTAGRCFGMFPHVNVTRDAAGAARFESTKMRRVGGEQYLLPHHEDQAEVSFATPLSPLPSIERADLANLADGATVALAGFGWAGFSKPFWASFALPARLTYLTGTLKIRRRPARRGGGVDYEVTPDDAAARMGAVDVGGPAFVIEGCRVTWLGTMLSRRIWPGRPTRIFVRPHTDLN